MRVWNILMFSGLLASALALAEGEHSHDFSPAVTDFHAVMAPAWHMAAGHERIKLTCEVATRFVALGGRILDSEIGGAKEQAAAGLVVASESLERDCLTDEARLIAAGLSKVHDAFHLLVKE